MTESEWLACDDPQKMLEHLRYSTQEEMAGTSVQSRARPLISNRKLRLFACACCRAAWASLTSEAHERVETLEAIADGRDTPGSLGLAEHDPCRLASSELVLHAMTPGGSATQAALLRDIAGNPFRPVTLPCRCAECGIPCGPPAAGYYCVRCGADQVHCPWLTWQGGIVVQLAQAAYEERARQCSNCKGASYLWYGGIGQCGTCHGTGRIEDGTLDPQRLLVLADALEEAGCEDRDILRHLRGWVRCAPHPTAELSDYKGEWVQGQGEWSNLRGPKGPIRCRRCGSEHKVGWLRTDAPHVRGCWVLDLLLGKE